MSTPENKMAQADLPICDSFWSPREILSSGIHSSPHKTFTAQPALISQLPILSAGDTGRPRPSAPPNQEPSLRLQAEAGSHEDLCSGSKASGRNRMLPAPRNTADAKLLYLIRILGLRVTQLAPHILIPQAAVSITQ